MLHHCNSKCKMWKLFSLPQSCRRNPRQHLCVCYFKADNQTSPCVSRMFTLAGFLRFYVCLIHVANFIHHFISSLKPIAKGHSEPRPMKYNAFLSQPDTKVFKNFFNSCIKSGPKYMYRVLKGAVVSVNGFWVCYTAYKGVWHLINNASVERLPPSLPMNLHYTLTTGNATVTSVQWPMCPSFHHQTTITHINVIPLDKAPIPFTFYTLCSFNLIPCEA